MIRLSLLLAVAGVTGAAASSAHIAPKTDAPKPVVVSSRKAIAQPVTQAAVNTSWYTRYGVYNAKTGTTSLVPVRFRPASGNLVRVGDEEGC